MLLKFARKISIVQDLISLIMDRNLKITVLLGSLKVSKNAVNIKKSGLRFRKKNKTDPEWIYGLSMTAVKFGISFTTRFLNQANALVILHQDGSMQIATGATEMGQGVNARISELVTSEFGLPRERARMMPTRTDKKCKYITDGGFIRN